MDINFAITAIAVVLAVLMGGIVLALLRRMNRAELHWKSRAQDLDLQLGSYDALFGAFPGLALP